MGWPQGWRQRIPITIDPTTISGGLSEDLTNFPVLVTLSSGTGINNVDLTKVFDELGLDSKKIAVTTSDGITQCPVEIEKWDSDNEQAWLWTKVPTIASETNTQLYLYYNSEQNDNTEYVGDTTSSGAQNVWDSNFVAVYHMAQDPNGDVADAIKDSTSNNYHSTPNGSMTSFDLVDGQVGKALDFDGSDDYLSRTSLSEINANDHTIEAVLNLIDTGTSDFLFHQGDNAQSNQQGWSVYLGSDMAPRLQWYNSGWRGVTGDTAIPIAENCAVTFGYDASEPDAYFWVNGALDPVEAMPNTLVSTTYPFKIGARKQTVIENWFPGTISEFRVSDTLRSDDWIKTTYQSNWNNLLWFGNLQRGVNSSPDTVCCIYDNPIYNASTLGVEIYNIDVSTDYYIAYITYSGVNTLAEFQGNLLIGTTYSGILYIPTTTVTGTNIYIPQNITSELAVYKQYPEILDNHVKDISACDDYLCVVTVSGVDHFNVGNSDSYDHSSGLTAAAEKCFQTCRGRFYYTSPTKIVTIYTYQCDWTEGTVGYEYDSTVSGTLLPPGGVVNDLSVAEGTSIYNGNNIIFAATTSGVAVIEERPGNEANSRYKLYLLEE